MAENSKIPGVSASSYLLSSDCAGLDAFSVWHLIVPVIVELSLIEHLEVDVGTSLINVDVSILLLVLLIGVLEVLSGAARKDHT